MSGSDSKYLSFKLLKKGASSRHMSTECLDIPKSIVRFQLKKGKIILKKILVADFLILIYKFINFLLKFSASHSQGVEKTT